ncbi:MAG: transporter substrate-binding domain-containing protein [Sneathiella sp.]|nr:transporter substrate-binding domain-containing protein [Sneathiella sp.]
MISMFRRGCLIVCLSITSLLLFTLYSSADIRLATGEYIPYTSQEIVGGGRSTELVQRVFKEMNEPMLIDFLPWKRVRAEVENGTYVAAFPYMKTHERRREFLFSDPILVWESDIYASRDTTIQYQDFSDLSGYTQCLPLGNAGHPTLDEMYRQGKIQRVSPVSCWKMLLRGRADFMVEDREVAKAQLLRTLGDDRDQIKTLAHGVRFDFGYVIFSKQHPRAKELLEKFNKALRQLIEIGEIEGLKLVDH